jgi:hypothetical protein
MASLTGGRTAQPLLIALGSGVFNAAQVDGEQPALTLDEGRSVNFSPI